MRSRLRSVSKWFTTAILSLTLASAVVAPAHAVDARKARADLLPVKSTVSAPAGAATLCKTYTWACAHTGRTTVFNAAALAAIKKINSSANRAVRPISDQRQWAVDERWSLPTKRGGDCEDYVLIKKKMLIEAGFSPDQLLIATVLDRERQPHAVLVIRMGSQDLVLDNLHDRIVSWRKTGYTFLRVQNPANPQEWVAVLAGGMIDKLS